MREEEGTEGIPLLDTSTTASRVHTRGVGTFRSWGVCGFGDSAPLAWVGLSLACGRMSAGLERMEGEEVLSENDEDVEDCQMVRVCGVYLRLGCLNCQEVASFGFLAVPWPRCP